MTDGQMDGCPMDGWIDGQKNVALTHPYQVWKSCSKFG